MVSPPKPDKILIVCLSLIFLSLYGCQGPSAASRASSPTITVDVLLVFPFKDMMRVYGENVTVRSPLSGRTFTTGKVVADADIFLTERLMSNLNQREGLRLIPWGQAQGVWARLLSGSQKERSEKDLILETGRTLGADAVLVGYVYRFMDRTGTNYSVDTPASVAFDLELVRLKDARIVWSRRFDETQKTLSDDIMQLNKFIKRKGRWITAGDMAASGLDDLLHTLPVP